MRSLFVYDILRYYGTIDYESLKRNYVDNTNDRNNPGRRRMRRVLFSSNAPPKGLRRSRSPVQVDY